jgi:SAM domain (Sterile alpha motif)
MQRWANRGAAMDVGGWLRRLGLEQYEASFRENKIDDAVLPSLTAEDLKDLGVGFVGDRRKLLDAIAAVRAEASAPTPLFDAPLATDKAAQDTAERRQVTVEAESEGAARRTVAAVPSPALAVPASSHASLMARLDRLGPAKELAQMMSLLGERDGYENAKERWESDRYRPKKWSFAAKMTVIALAALVATASAMTIRLVFFENKRPLAEATARQIVVPKQTATETAPGVARQSGETPLTSAEQNRPRDPTKGFDSGLTPDDTAADTKSVGQGQNAPPQALAATPSPVRPIDKEELANGLTPADTTADSKSDGQAQNAPPQALAATPSPARLIDKEELANGPTPADTAADTKSVGQGQNAPPQALAATPSPVRPIDKEELANLLKRGRYLLSIGDIAPARLLLERAADAHEASAAFDLAGTYDPAVLTRSHVSGIAPDLAMARMWYEKALNLGHSEAQQRLAKLQK